MRWEFPQIKFKILSIRRRQASKLSCLEGFKWPLLTRASWNIHAGHVKGFLGILNESKFPNHVISHHNMIYSELWTNFRKRGIISQCSLCGSPGDRKASTLLCFLWWVESFEQRSLWQLNFLQIMQRPWKERQSYCLKDNPCIPRHVLLLFVIMKFEVASNRHLISVSPDQISLSALTFTYRV